MYDENKCFLNKINGIFKYLVSLHKWLITMFDIFIKKVNIMQKFINQENRNNETKAHIRF